MQISTVRITNFKSFADTGDVQLGRINLLVGRNNYGKSAFVQALQLMQQPGRVSVNDIRLGQQGAAVEVTLVGPNLPDDIQRYFSRPEIKNDQTKLSIGIGRASDQQHSISLILTDSDSNRIAVNPIRSYEPNNFIYTYLSKRKVSAFDQSVDLTRTRSVESDLRYLVSKVARLSNSDYEHAREYETLCKAVLGFRISTHASASGQQAGIPVGPFGYIALEAMGEGVSSQLGLITDLCMADGHLFLIEEPENDIHPEGLKTLLNVIIEKSQTNQFLITTHSNIVTRYLGAAPDSKIFEFQSEYVPNVVPTSTVREVERTPQARIEVLRQLGYELSDFDLWEGWIILEESSAEFVLQYLIPWFVPRLARVRTVAAGGVNKVEPTFEDYRRLFLFAHLEPQYRNRAWVIVDGDSEGQRVAAELRAKYGDWPADHFRTWSEENFERYYPRQFEAQVNDVLAKPHRERWEAKKALHREVSLWCHSNPEEARKALSESAREVIALLEEVDRALFDLKT